MFDTFATSAGLVHDTDTDCSVHDMFMTLTLIQTARYKMAAPSIVFSRI